VDAPIERCAHTGRLILSTGMATCRSGARPRACNSGRLVSRCRTARRSSAARQRKPAGDWTLAAAFSLPVGLSDHGADTSVVPIAVVLGSWESATLLTAEDDWWMPSEHAAGLADSFDRGPCRVSLGSGVMNACPLKP
jgi:hypothetical protein